MMNFETINGRIIETHLRFADQRCDLYWAGWMAALVDLYANGNWKLSNNQEVEGYFVPLFARHGGPFKHPALEA